jgi:hypothetical protein
MFSQRLLPRSIVIPSCCCAGSVVCLNNNVWVNCKLTPNCRFRVSRISDYLHAIQNQARLDVSSLIVMRDTFQLGLVLLPYNKDKDS